MKRNLSIREAEDAWCSMVDHVQKNVVFGSAGGQVGEEGWVNG